MANQTSSSTSIVAAILGGAAIVAIIGTVLPNLIGMTGPVATWVRVVFYAVAAADVAIALWLRARIRRARQEATRGTVRRQ